MKNKILNLVVNLVIMLGVLITFIMVLINYSLYDTQPTNMQVLMIIFGFLLVNTKKPDVDNQTNKNDKQ